MRKPFSYSRRPALLPLFAWLALLCGGCSRDSNRPDSTDKFSGSTSCRQCHEKFYELWSTSHHGLAMQPVNETFVKKSLKAQDKAIEIGTRKFKVDISTRRLIEEGPEVRKTYAMIHVLGGKNVYYFLTPTERGRLQVLPLAYDVRSNEWFNATASMVRHFRDSPDTAIDWTDSLLTFNTACHGCHVSQLSKNYNLKTDTYRTVWQEPGINCETCHGPGGEHIRVCLAAPTNTVPHDLKIISAKNMSPAQRDATCAPCHAKMNPITTNFMPGARFFDHYNLAALEDLDFYPDGRDLGENYTYTLWLTSPCVKAGKLECLHCHTSSGRYKFTGDKANEACRPCHKERVEMATEHTHHKAGSKGNICISCHMPMTSFARMQRSDHSMRPPAPAATIAFKSPNACNICHNDKDAKWSDNHVREWRSRDYQAPVLYRAGLVDAARKRDWRRLNDILTFITDEKSDSIFVASLIRLLATCDAPAKWPVIRNALKNTSPFVRSTAAQALAGDDSRASLDSLITAVGDEYRLVRTSAASALAHYANALPDMESRRKCDAALGELESSFMCFPDSWTSHYNMGNYYEERGWSSQALASYEHAIKLRPDSILPMVNAAIIHARQENLEAAMNLLKKALGIDQKNAAVNFNLGLALAEQNKMTEAESHLRAALATDPSMAQAAYNLGVMLNKRAEYGEGIKWCQRAVELMPNNQNYANALNFYLNTQKKKEGNK